MHHTDKIIDYLVTLCGDKTRCARFCFCIGIPATTLCYPYSVLGSTGSIILYIRPHANEIGPGDEAMVVFVALYLLPQSIGGGLLQLLVDFCALVICKVGPGPGDGAMSKEHLLLPVVSYQLMQKDVSMHVCT